MRKSRSDFSMTLHYTTFMSVQPYSSPYASTHFTHIHRIYITHTHPDMPDISLSLGAHVVMEEEGFNWVLQEEKNK